MNSESETVEERAQFEKWAVVRIPDGPIFHWIESEHRYAHELYQIAFEAYLLSSSLLQEKERERNALVTLLRQNARIQSGRKCVRGSTI